MAAPTPADLVLDNSAEPTPENPTAIATMEPPPTLTVMPTTPPNVPSLEEAEFELGEALPKVPTTPQESAEATPVAVVIDDQGYRELAWEEMVPPGFRPEDIMAKYQDELNQMQDGDSAAMDLYDLMQEEFMNAPINSELNAQKIKLPGFIAPLEYQDDTITEFLLVPYFGACIHVPPPPANQTVYVTAADGNGVDVGDSYYPVWVVGELLAEGQTTDIGVAGYRIQNATITPYDYNQ
ncbi:MAG: DUF3299 domain-containing protein [Anaerolineae bacterium]|nr:DUF3299 domain-containing protein [Anaerolineae bacterium]MCO5193447.1 DUF3299 domain-containing protein [Anaerolineae bacterium]MCO5198934.1 DUF3299 domain-containing protein [Anaerolineae bacterium]MCO5204929.1 DUF3299 domain-containing protein [Anaerolineae bacterium]